MAEGGRHTHLPGAERMSTVTAMILSSYALAHFIQLPGGELSVQLPGFYVGFRFGVQELTALVVAGMTASGADWLLREHPHLKTSKLFEHWLLPGVTAWAIGLPLLQLPISIIWWIGLSVAGVLVLLVLIAEYIVVDPSDLRQPPAAAGLTAVAFALFLMLATAVRYSGMRLFFLLPTLAIAVFLVSLRILRLQKPTSWAFLDATVVTLITVQIASALHYSPLSPVSFSLALLGPAYGLTHFFSDLSKGEAPEKALVEPVIILAIVWITALLIN